MQKFNLFVNRCISTRTLCVDVDAKREARELQTTLTLTQEKLARVEQRVADVQERYACPRGSVRT